MQGASVAPAAEHIFGSAQDRQVQRISAHLTLGRERLVRGVDGARSIAVGGVIRQYGSTHVMLIHGPLDLAPPETGHNRRRLANEIGSGGIDSNNNVKNYLKFNVDCHAYPKVLAHTTSPCVIDLRCVLLLIR